jgi:hypothetical protein
MMKFISRGRVNRWHWLSAQALVVALLGAGIGYAQVPPGAGQVSIPESSIEKPGDVGVRAHTNTQIFVPNRGPDGAQAPSGNGSPGGEGSRSPQAPDTKRAIGSAPPQ